MTEKIRTALVGCGKVGHTHAQALKALPHSDFVAAFDVDQSRADAFAKSYGVRGYADLERMIDDAGVQMISICTPHPTHAGVIAAAAQKGVHSLVEKPLTSDLADADRAIEACRAAGVKLGVVSQRRLYPPVARTGRGHPRRQDRQAGAGHAGGHGLARRGLLPLGRVARALGCRGRRRARQPDAAPARHAAMADGLGDRRTVRLLGQREPPVYRGGGHGDRGVAL